MWVYPIPAKESSRKLEVDHLAIELKNYLLEKNIYVHIDVTQQRF